MIHVIDYKLGNVGSVVNMLKYLGATVNVVARPEQLKDASKIILPGVGTFNAGSQALKHSGFSDAIKEAVSVDKAMLLGICLGMQLLSDGSEEGEGEGLGLIPGQVKRLNPENKQLPIPHMGWNRVSIRKASKLFREEIQPNPRFYFVHAYHVCCKDDKDVAGTTHYGEEFTAIIARDRVMGVQFHPEKSHKYGKILLKNFVEAV